MVPASSPPVVETEYSTASPTVKVSGLVTVRVGGHFALEGNGVLQDHVSAVNRDKLDGDVEGAGLLEGDTEPAGGVGEREPGGGTKGVAGEVTPGVIGRIKKILELLNLGSVIGEDTP